MVALLSFAGACKYESVRNEPYSAPVRSERTFQRLIKRDPDSGVAVREWTAYIEPGKRSVKHGDEVVRYASGSTQWTRTFEFGEPAGEWTSWYEDGTLRSRAVFAGADRTELMSFWHPNGELSAQGPAVDGVRVGEWTVWHENGKVAARGPFVRSLRQGEWAFFDDTGELIERVTFQEHRRVMPS